MKRAPRYVLVIGCLTVGRVLYVMQGYLYVLLSRDFLSTFRFTGIIDTAFTILCLVFTLRGGPGMRDLFLPSREVQKAS